MLFWCIADWTANKQNLSKHPPSELLASDEYELQTSRSYIRKKTHSHIVPVDPWKRVGECRYTSTHS